MTAMWYLVFELASTGLGPPTMQRPVIGPMTQAECQKAAEALPSLTLCRRAVGMTTMTVGPMGYAYPIFDDGTFVPVATIK